MIGVVGLSALLDGGVEQVPAAVAEASAAGALDLRVAAVLDEAWEAAGFVEHGPGELVRPLPRLLEDASATADAGRQLAGQLCAGDLLVLTGPLGAGKTTLTSGVGEGLGVRGRVTSPTFVLAREHRGPLPLLHVDAYRLLGGSGGLDDLELDLALAVGVVVVEWGEGLVEDLADSRLEVQLDRPDRPASFDAGTTSDDHGGRVLTVRAVGPRWSVVQPP